MHQTQFRASTTILLSQRESHCNTKFYIIDFILLWLSVFFCSVSREPLLYLTHGK